MQSIKELGIIQPLITRRVDGKLELIAGERRWRASQALGLKTVPVIEREATDKEVLEMALIENLQREDLNPIEEAASLQPRQRFWAQTGHHRQARWQIKSQRSQLNAPPRSSTLHPATSC